ncbi:MAG: hypothetical protein HY645_10755 [Acidobacteria bacterium]|nr:hypothetical protein [Acidobacteriota bacterium]
MKKNVLLLLMTVLSFSIASAATVRTVNLFEMVALAERVFWGRCVAVENQLEEGTSFPIVRYTFEVLDGIKGVHTGETIVFKQASSGLGGIAGLPQYQKGKEVLLFLYSESDSGLTSPVGMAQGAFRVTKTPDQQVSFINGVQNENLAVNLSPVDIAESGLSLPEVEQMKSRGPITRQALTAVVEKINNYQLKKKTRSWR